MEEEDIRPVVNMEGFVRVSKLLCHPLRSSVSPLPVGRGCSLQGFLAVGAKASQWLSPLTPVTVEQTDYSSGEQKLWIWDLKSLLGRIPFGLGIG